jgi:sulfite exporter TauE/SafE
MLINLIIGSIMAYIGTILGNTILIVNEHIFNSLGASSIIISGIYLFVQVLRRKHNPHSKQEGEITETFQHREGRFRKRSSFFLGILAGLPPCVFETYIYSQAISFSASSGFINGVAVVFFFNIGSLLGLIPLSMFGIFGSYARKRLEQKSLKKKDKSGRLQTASIIELISSVILIIIGTVLLILALLGINVFKLPEIPPI